MCTVSGSTPTHRELPFQAPIETFTKLESSLFNRLLQNNNDMQNLKLVPFASTTASVGRHQQITFYNVEKTTLLLPIQACYDVE